MDAYDKKHLRAGTLVNLHSNKPALPEQCPHADARGRYVISSDAGWLVTDPGTKMQVSIWVKDNQERRRRVHWLCFECGEIMPLGSYEA